MEEKDYDIEENEDTMTVSSLESESEAEEGFRMVSYGEDIAEVEETVGGVEGESIEEGVLMAERMTPVVVDCGAKSSTTSKIIFTPRQLPPEAHLVTPQGAC